MRVQIVDPPAYTPPYDRSLAAALARAGAEVELVTSRFAHGEVPAARGYSVSEVFYDRSSDLTPGSPLRRAGRAVEHVGGMLAHRRAAAAADVVHYQWLAVPRIDALLVAPRHPRLLTPHGWLRDEAWREGPNRPLRRLFDRMDGIVALSEYGAHVLRARAGVPGERVHVIPHGALDYLTALPDPAPLPAELEGAGEAPVILFLGLLRPYKGLDVLLEAFRSVRDAELWIVGRPFGVDLAELRAAAERAVGTVRFVPRFVPDRELPAIFERTDVVVLPHRDAEQSGVLYTALAFGKAIVMTDVGGFPEVAAHGAGRLVPAGDSDALAGALVGLLDQPGERQRLAAAARAAATGPYSWERVAAQTLDLYRELGA